MVGQGTVAYFSLLSVQDNRQAPFVCRGGYGADGLLLCLGKQEHLRDQWSREGRVNLENQAGS